MMYFKKLISSFLLRSKGSFISLLITEHEDTDIYGVFFTDYSRTVLLPATRSNNNLNLRIKTLTAGAYATVYVRLIGLISLHTVNMT